MGELAGLRSDCVDLKRSRIFVNRSLTVLKGGLVLERILTQKPLTARLDYRCSGYWLKAGRERSRKLTINGLPNFMRCSFGRSPYNPAPQTQENRASEVDLVAS